MYLCNQAQIAREMMPDESEKTVSLANPTQDDISLPRKCEWFIYFFHY